MSTKRVTYPKDMREYAATSKRTLCTLDVGGMVFQGPCNEAEVKFLQDAFLKLLELRGKAKESSRG